MNDKTFKDRITTVIIDHQGLKNKELICIP